MPEYSKYIENGKFSAADYLPGATVVDGRDAYEPGRKPVVANGADAASKQAMAISTKGSTFQVVSLAAEAGAAYNAQPAATLNYLITPSDGSGMAPLGLRRSWQPQRRSSRPPNLITPPHPSLRSLVMQRATAAPRGW